jgi:hypothetical protein
MRCQGPGNKPIWIRPRLTAKPPPTVVKGELAITPAKNRVIMMVCRFCAVAIAAEKQMKINIGTSIDILLPYSSDNGPNTRGGRISICQTSQNREYDKGRTDGTRDETQYVKGEAESGDLRGDVVLLGDILESRTEDRRCKSRAH